MNCISNDIIQKYVDNEASSEEVKQVEQHISACEKCASKVAQQKQLALNVKDALDLLVEKETDIPAFKKPLNIQTKKHSRYIKRFIYSASAACLMLFFLLLLKSNRKYEQPTLVMQTTTEDYDANQPLSKQNLVIEIIGSDGCVTKYYLE